MGKPIAGGDDQRAFGPIGIKEAREDVEHDDGYRVLFASSWPIGTHMRWFQVDYWARELLPSQGLPDHDHILIGREGGIERDFGRLREELGQALARAADGKGDPPRKPRTGKGGKR